MKTNENEIIVTVPWDELCAFHSVDSNRCGYLTWAEAEANGFSLLDWNRYQQRANKLKRTILANGFSQASVFTLAKDENNNHYILDGQGRRMALWLLAQEHGYDLSQLEFKCRLFTKPMSIKEMSALIKDMNTNSTNWQTKDLRRSDAIASDDPEVLKAYKYASEVAERLGVPDFAANLLIFGESATHQRKSGKIFSTRDYSPTKDLFIDVYEQILNALDRTPSQIGGEEVLHSKSTRTAIRNSNFLIALRGCLRDIIMYHGSIEDAIEDIHYFKERIISAAKGDSIYVKTFMKMGKEKAALKEKMRKHCRKTSVKTALFGRRSN